MDMVALAVAEADPLADADADEDAVAASVGSGGGKYGSSSVDGGGGSILREPLVGCADREAVGVGIIGMYGATDIVEDGLLSADFVCVRLGRPVMVARGEIVCVVVDALETEGAAEALPESEGNGLSEADAEAEEDDEGRAVRVAVRVTADVRVAKADLVISRVRVDDADGPKLFTAAVGALEPDARLLTDGLLLADVEPDREPVAEPVLETTLLGDVVEVCAAVSVLEGVDAGLAVAIGLLVAGAVAAGDSEACADCDGLAVAAGVTVASAVGAEDSDAIADCEGDLVVLGDRVLERLTAADTVGTALLDGETATPVPRAVRL